MSVLVVGCNHRTAPLELRERLTLDADAARRAMDALRAEFDDCGAVILSTCNRSEFYVALPGHGRLRRDDLVAFLSRFCDVPVDSLGEHLYVHRGREAIGHLFRVACSLDSMVIGETQILNQVKQALADAVEAGSAGRGLVGLFQWALHVAKEVHTATEISTGQVSVGSVAVKFAGQIFSHFDDKTVLMIGAGDMGKLTLQHVLETAPKRVLVANRTPERAERLARRYHAEPFGLDRIDECLADADIIITSTGSADPVLTVALVEASQEKRNYRPLFIIDIAVPRDVEPAVGDVDNVYLYNIDDLQSVVDAGAEGRDAQVSAVDRIIAEHVDEYVRWRDSRAVGPVLAALRKRLGEITDGETDWAMPKLSGDAKRDREVIDQLLHRMVGKLMHGPSETLRRKAGEGGVEVYAETLRQMFGLDEDENETS